MTVERAIPGISVLARADSLRQCETSPFDVVIIGGGIAGAGIARECTLRGLSCALLEAQDFASGTSSRSSKLIHGGLRYLPRGEVALVRKTARERKVIHRLAPHLAEKRWMALPARSRTHNLTLRAAVGTYEKLGGVEGIDLHQAWNKRRLEAEEPAFRRDLYPFATLYREYLTDDARLVLANIRAAAGRGATMLNRARVTRILVEGERANGVEAECGLTGERFVVRGKVIVNAAGPWIDAVMRLESPGAKPMLTLSKGIHVVLPREKLPIQHMWVCNASDNRPLFAVPRGSVVYVGTTDTLHEGGTDLWPSITGEDVDYLLDVLPNYFSTPKPKQADVVSAWAGLRALVAQPGQKPSEMSRKEEILEGPGHVVTVAGGKLTGYRDVALRVLEAVERQLGTKVPRIHDEDALPGGDFDGNMEILAGGLSRVHGLPADSARRLAQLYGTEANRVAHLGPQRLTPTIDVLEGEVDWAVTMEAASTVEDVFYRRTRAALFEPDAERVLEAIANRMGRILGWDDSRRLSEIAKCQAQFRRDLSFQGQSAPRPSQLPVTEAEI